MDHPKLEEWKTVWRERRSVTMVYILLRISLCWSCWHRFSTATLKTFFSAC